MNLNNYQTTVINDIEKRPEFSFFVKINDKDLRDLHNPDRRPGPICVLWYDKKDAVRLTRVGLLKILREI